jgi:hypothetical protein
LAPSSWDGRIVVGEPGEPIGSWSSQAERLKFPPGATLGLSAVAAVALVLPMTPSVPTTAAVAAVAITDLRLMGLGLSILERIVKNVNR